MTAERRQVLYTRYPISSVLIYNGATATHYLVGGIAMVIGYRAWPGYAAAAAYLAFSFIEMHIHMPMRVCRNCVYYRLGGSRCIAGLNLLSRKLSGEGSVKEFHTRAKGPLSPNNLYIASIVVPIVAVVPALVLRFSLPVLILLIVLVGLLLFRFFVIFPKIACVHCRAQNMCPQAKSMGFGKVAASECPNS